MYNYYSDDIDEHENTYLKRCDLYGKDFDAERDYLIGKFPMKIEAQYQESFIKMFLYAFTESEPNALQIAKDCQFNEEAIAILGEDFEKYIKIQERYREWGNDDQ